MPGLVHHPTRGVSTALLVPHLVASARVVHHPTQGGIHCIASARAGPSCSARCRACVVGPSPSPATVGSSSGRAWRYLSCCSLLLFFGQLLWHCFCCHGLWLRRCTSKAQFYESCGVCATCMEHCLVSCRSGHPVELHCLQIARNSCCLQRGHLPRQRLLWLCFSSLT